MNQITTTRLEEQIILQIAEYLDIKVVDLFVNIKELVIRVKEKEDYYKFEKILQWNHIIPADFKCLPYDSYENTISFAYSRKDYCFLIGNNVPSALL